MAGNGWTRSGGRRMRTADLALVVAALALAAAFVPLVALAVAREANCLGVDPELFFPGRGDMDGIAAARAICRGCSVREDCLEYALANREKQGIWGGLSERERRGLRRRRRFVA